MSKVYIKTNTSNIIVAINSDDFLSSVSGWTRIAEGEGDRYSHAQTQYLAKGLTDDLGRFNYKYVDGTVTELTESEKESLFKTNPEAIVSAGSDYGEVGTWSDLNPDGEDRLYRFVTISGSARNIAIANSTDHIVGTSNLKENVGFIGNYTPGSESDRSKVIVSILGVSYVKTSDETIQANDRVMSDDQGYAVKSSNNLGYRVLSVPEEGLLEIVTSPNTDLIQRIKTDVSNIEAEMQNVGGNFIDETNALASAINVQEYTALEDCYVELSSSWGSKFHYLINGIQIMDDQPSGYRNYFLKSGQTLTAIAEDGKTVKFKVKHAFGLK